MTCTMRDKCIHREYCILHIGRDENDCIFYSRDDSPMTNEEWLKSLDTEKLAEWIAIIIDCSHCPVKNCDDEPCKKQFIRWLKEKHNG